MRARALAGAILLLGSGPAGASPVGGGSDPSSTGPAGRPPRLDDAIVWVDPVRDVAPDAAAASELAKILYVNRCTGGCTLTPGTNDSRRQTSSIIPGTVHITEYAGTQDTFDATIACLRQVYGPYDVQIVTDDPGEALHHEAILAGKPEDIGQGPRIGGIAPASCDPLNNVISFSFANLVPADSLTQCWTVAQESAHSFGLPNHVFECSDPMTYLDGCGQKFFRNKVLPCGDFVKKPCLCGVPGQNSHAKLRAVFGDGIAPAGPEVAFELPSDGDLVRDKFGIFFTAQDPRLVDHAEIWINGSKYLRLGGNGYANRLNDYSASAPKLPDGYLDVEVRAFDDLGIAGSAKITVQKGLPCTNKDACFASQTCEAGHCVYPPASTALGDACTYDQACVEGVCGDSGGERRCALRCNPQAANACPDGDECVGDGYCYPPSGGCCALAGGRPLGGDGALVVLGGGAAIVLALRRRRAWVTGRSGTSSRPRS